MKDREGKMNQYRAEILEKASKVESLLVNLGGHGSGIHGKLTSIERTMQADMNSKIRRLATIRNKAAHDPNFETNIWSFRDLANEIINSLTAILAARKRTDSKRQSNKARSEQPSKNWSEMDWKERTKVVGAGALVVGLLILGATK